MTVYCGAYNCRFNKNGDCDNDTVYIDDTGNCEDFAEFYRTAEYLQPYYIAVKSADGRLGKTKKQGKKIEYQGYSFYTNESPEDVESGDFRCTEEKNRCIADVFTFKESKMLGKIP